MGFDAKRAARVNRKRKRERENVKDLDREIRNSLWDEESEFEQIKVIGETSKVIGENDD